MRKKDLLRLYEEQRAKIAQLEECVKTQDGLIDGYRAREAAVVSVLASAQETAKQRVEAAERRAGELEREAQRKAEEIERQARAESERILAGAKEDVAEYQAAIDRYNAALETAAEEAAENARRFASFARGRKLREAQIAQDAAAFPCAQPQAEAIELPDAAGDPAQLMRNIYRIENRVLPDSVVGGMQPQPDEMPEPAFRFDGAGAEPDFLREPAPADQPAAAPAPAPEPEEAAPRSLAEVHAESVVDKLMEERPVVQTVAAVLEDNTIAADEEDISLDALLEEIIRSGEQNDG